MTSSTVSTQRTKEQAGFALRVKTALWERGESIAQLAKEVGVARTTASLAINRGLYQPTRERIAAYLNIPL